MFQTKVVEEIEVHVLMYNKILSKVVSSYEKICKNKVEPDGQQMAI
jgi:hypothetical protein